MDAIKVRVLESKDCVTDSGKPYSGYVRIITNFSTQTLKTKTCEKSKNPSFEEEFNILLPDIKKTETAFVIIRMMRKQSWPHQDAVLGEASFPIDDGKDFDSWLDLENSKKKANGKIHIVVTFPKKEVAKASAAQSSSKSLKAAFDEKYVRQEELGKGAFSVVYRGLREPDKKPVAIKCVSKVGQSPEVIKLLKREISVMQKLQHPGIVSLLDVIENDEMITMVLELVNGGELYDQIIAHGNFTERDAVAIVVQLLKALDYMHSNGVAHRDLKPENLLCEEGVKVVKIADFGLSKDFSMASVMQTCCGSPSYVAPEVLAGGAYDTACDVWSIGVITYVLLSGYLPFFADTQPELFEKIMEGTFSFSQPLWKNVSREAKDFVTQCLTLEPASRPTAGALLKHAWITHSSIGGARLETTSSMADLRSGFNPKNRGR